MPLSEHTGSHSSVEHEQSLLHSEKSVSLLYDTPCVLQSKKIGFIFNISNRLCLQKKKSEFNFLERSIYHCHMALMYQHWPIVWDGEPSHRNIVTLSAKLQQQEKVWHEGCGKGELSSWHQTQFIPLHQQPSQEDPYCHHWQVQHTYKKNTRRSGHWEAPLRAGTLSLSDTLICSVSPWVFKLLSTMRHKALPTQIMTFDLFNFS